MKPLVALTLAIVFIGGAFAAGAVTIVALNSQPQTAAVADATPRQVTLDPNTIAAKSAVLYDATTGILLYQKDPNAQLPLASLTKLNTAYTVLSSRDPQTKVTITQSDLHPEGGGVALVPGEELSLYDLMKLGLVASNNDAMSAAAASLGSDYLSLVNKTAQSLGLTRTYFLNPTGLDLTSDTSGGYGSAYDVARLTAAFYKQYPEFFEFSSTKTSITVQSSKRTITAKATAVPLLDIPGFVGAKTGYTDLAGGNLSAIFDLDIGHPVVVVVLGSTETGRFSDVRTILTAARKQLTKN